MPAHSLIILCACTPLAVSGRFSVLHLLVYAGLGTRDPLHDAAARQAVHWLQGGAVWWRGMGL